MGKAKHTPGPWFVFGNGHCVGGPCNLVWDDNPKQQTAGVAMCGMRLRYPEEATANARLIAAAPDLLDACRAALEFIANGIELGAIRWPVCGDDPASGTPGLLRAAIAKAEGSDK